MKLEEGGLSSSPGVVLYPAYCLINHACRWTQLEQSSKSDLSCFYMFTIFPFGLIWGLCTVLVCDWLVQQQHQLPEAARPELGTKVPGADQEGGGDLNKVSHLPTNLANPRNFSFSLFSKVRLLNCWQLSKKKGHRQVLVLQVRKQTFSKFKIAKLIFQLPLCTVQWSFWAGHPHVRIVWKKKHRNTTCEDSLKNHENTTCVCLYKSDPDFSCTVRTGQSEVVQEVLADVKIDWFFVANFSKKNRKSSFLQNQRKLKSIKKFINLFLKKAIVVTNMISQ